MNDQNPARSRSQQEYDQQIGKLEAWWKQADSLELPSHLDTMNRHYDDLSTDDRHALIQAASIHGDVFNIGAEGHLNYRISYSAISDPEAERVDRLWSLHGPEVGSRDHIRHAQGASPTSRDMTADARLALVSQIQYADEASACGDYFDFGGIPPEIETEDQARRFMEIGDNHTADIRRVRTLEPIDSGEFGGGREHKEHFTWSVYERGQPAQSPAGCPWFCRARGPRPVVNGRTEPR